MIDPDVHEVERNLSLVATMGYPVDGSTALSVCRSPLRHAIADALPDLYVVAHRGASVPAA